MKKGLQDSWDLSVHYSIIYFEQTSIVVNLNNYCMNQAKVYITHSLFTEPLSAGYEYIFLGIQNMRVQTNRQSSPNRQQTFILLSVWRTMGLVEEWSTTQAHAMNPLFAHTI